MAQIENLGGGGEFMCPWCPPGSYTYVYIYISINTLAIETWNLNIGYVTAMFSPDFIHCDHTLILNTVVVSTKHLLHVCHCEQSSMFTKFYILC